MVFRLPPYGVYSINRPNLTRGRPSEGVGRGRCHGVLYRYNNREFNLILQLLVFLTIRSPAVENGCQKGINHQRRAPILYD